MVGSVMQRFSMFWSLEVSGKVLDCKFGWVGRVGVGCALACIACVRFCVHVCTVLLSFFLGLICLILPSEYQVECRCASKILHDV